MVENINPGAISTLVGGWVLTKEIIGKVLGPTADYYGDELRDWAKARRENTGRVFQRAEARLGDKIDEPGCVHPKVLKEMIEEASFDDSELGAEYFGGVLASSRSGVSRDDRGAWWARKAASLTAYQLRTHYVVYQCCRDLFGGSDLYVGNAAQADQMTVFIDINAYNSAMEIEDGESLADIATHAFHGLRQEGLIGSNWVSGGREHLSTYWPAAPSAGILVRPSALGSELYMWALGQGMEPIARFLDPNLDLTPNVDVKLGGQVLKASIP